MRHVDWCRSAAHQTCQIMVRVEVLPTSKMGVPHQQLGASEGEDENGVAANGAIERDPTIEAWMKEHPGELGGIAHEWFEAMRKCGDEVRELMHDGCPVACLGDAPFGYVNVFTSHVNVGSFTARRYRIRPACCKARASSCAM
jgi:hypothetical protein